MVLGVEFCFCIVVIVVGVGWVEMICGLIDGGEVVVVVNYDID